MRPASLALNALFQHVTWGLAAFCAQSHIGGRISYKRAVALFLCGF